VSSGVPTGCGGRPCPPWCRSEDHEALGHLGELARINLGAAARRATALVRPVDLEDARVAVFGEPRVQAGADCLSGSGFLYLGPGDAVALAELIELLAGASPARCREVAAAIRKAAADITGGAGSGRERGRS
jgi:hypothetical protein